MSKASVNAFVVKLSEHQSNSTYLFPPSLQLYICVKKNKSTIDLQLNECICFKKKRGGGHNKTDGHFPKATYIL